MIALLQADGFSAVAVQNPLTSIEDDAAATARILAGLDGPVVLVGHSWGGVAITEAGADAKVASLVYVSAFAPDLGETGGALIAAHPAPPGLSTIATDPAGFVYQTEVGMLENLAPDLPPEEARVLAATQGRLPSAAFGQTVTTVAWRTKPCRYVLTTEDRVVSPELQAMFAARMNAATTRLNASHMSLLSRPDAVARVIEEAAIAC